MGAGDRLDLCAGMHENPEALAQGAEQQVEQPAGGLHQAGIDGVHQAEEVPGLGRGGFEQRPGVVVAADDPVQGHDVRRRQLPGEIHEVPVQVLDPPGQAPAFRFLLRGLQIPGGGVHVDRLGRPCRQEPVMHRTEAAADVQDRAPGYPFGGDALDEQAGGLPGTAPAIAAELRRGPLLVEHLFNAHALNAAHDYS